MAVSKCGSCGATGRWELSQVSPSAGNFKYHFIQCSSCGVPVTAVEYLNIGATVESNDKKLNKEIDELKQQLRNIEYLLRNMR